MSASHRDPVYGDMPEEGRHSRQCQPSGHNLCGSGEHAIEGNCRAAKLTATGVFNVQCNASGVVMLGVGCREAEREAMLERQREGIAKAKREGRYKGRVPTTRRQAAEIIRLTEAGVRPSENRR